MGMNMEIKIGNQIMLESILPILKVEEFKFVWEPNKHAFLNLEGYLNEYAENNLEKAYGSKIRLWFEEGGITLFHGYLINVKVNHEGKTSKVSLRAVSASFRVDGKPESESFQNPDMNYAEIARRTAERAGARVICTEGNGVSIGKPVIRYEETAWQFVIRLASHMGTCIVPDIVTGEQAFWFGMRKGNRIPSFTGEEYSVGICRQRDGGGIHTVYKADSREFYKIGDRTNVDGAEVTICSVEAFFQKGELTFRYLMKKKETVNVLYQEAFTGLGLKGTIIEVVKEQVRIALDIDGGKETGGYFYRWYPETGNSLYAMPEPGTRAVLYVGERDEREAFVLHSLPNAMGDRWYYKSRHLDTKEGNMLHLNEESIDISNGGSRTVCLGNGFVSANSGQKLYISAEGGVKMSAKRIIMRTPDELNICQE